jgi:hypothetical protein
MGRGALTVAVETLLGVPVDAVLDGAVDAAPDADEVEVAVEGAAAVAVAVAVALLVVVVAAELVGTTCCVNGSRARPIGFARACVL